MWVALYIMIGVVIGFFVGAIAAICDEIRYRQDEGNK